MGLMAPNAMVCIHQFFKYTPTHLASRAEKTHGKKSTSI